MPVFPGDIAAWKKSVERRLTALATAAFKGPKPTAWVTPALQAGWTNGASGFVALRYRKQSFDVVHLLGIIQNTSGSSKAAGSLVFTLPAGYRPTASFRSTAAISSPLAIGAVLVASTGNVTNDLVAVANNLFWAIDVAFPTT